jgi:hypothetical protein
MRFENPLSKFSIYEGLKMDLLQCWKHENREPPQSNNRCICGQEEIGVTINLTGSKKCMTVKEMFTRSPIKSVCACVVKVPSHYTLQIMKKDSSFKSWK